MKNKKDESNVLPFRRSLSERALGFSWSNLLPLELGNDYQARMGNYGDFLNFLKDPRAAEVLSHSPFPTEQMSSRKMTYCNETHDVFLIEHQNKIVGTTLWQLADWDAYYIRFSLVLPELHQQGLFSTLLTNLFKFFQT